MRRPLTTITLLLGAAFLTGCSTRVEISSSNTIDPARVEDAIGRNLQGQNPGLRVDSVTCPADVKPVEGAAFQCTAELEGVQAPFTVTVTHVDASTGEFKYSWKPAKAILIMDKAVKILKSKLQDQAPNATVDCGAASVQVVEVGGAIECTIAEGSKRHVVRGVIEDVDGTIHFEQQG